MGRVRVSPAEFRLVAFDAAEIARLCEDVQAVVGFPAADVEIEVDEELFAPLVGTATDVVDGVVHVWVSGANFEDTRRTRAFSAADARRELALCLLRGADRLGEGFADAPPDRDCTRAERAAWDVWAAGRADRLGIPARRARALYDFRLQHGFTDAADAAFDRCWDAETMTWAGIREICAATGAADRPASKIPVDLLRRR